MLDAVKDPKLNSWKDFTLEEHVEAFLKVPHGCIVQCRKIAVDTLRVNVVKSAGLASTIIQSRVLRAIQTADGYTLEDITL